MLSYNSCGPFVIHKIHHTFQNFYIMRHIIFSENGALFFYIIKMEPNYNYEDDIFLYFSNNWPISPCVLLSICCVNCSHHFVLISN